MHIRFSTADFRRDALAGHDPRAHDGCSTLNGHTPSHTDHSAHPSRSYLVSRKCAIVLRPLNRPPLPASDSAATNETDVSARSRSPPLLPRPTALFLGIARRLIPILVRCHHAYARDPHLEVWQPDLVVVVRRGRYGAHVGALGVVGVGVGIESEAEAEVNIPGAGIAMSTETRTRGCSSTTGIGCAAAVRLGVAWRESAVVKAFRLLLVGMGGGARRKVQRAGSMTRRRV
ncbi:hypothetical protein K438DRAFT_1849894, partial [Mycena galopus ATCC 62051]